MKRKFTFTDFAVFAGYLAIILTLALMVLLLTRSGYEHQNVEPNWGAYIEIKRIYNETR